jgi:hypothetical protein
MNKAEVKFIGTAQKMELASEIFLHEDKGNLKLNAANGTIVYVKDAISNAKISSGRNYVGVFVPTKVNAARKQNSHALVLNNYKVGDIFSYYFGGGWSKWSYSTDEDWFKVLNQFTEFSKKIINSICEVIF